MLFPALNSITVSDFRSIEGEWTVPLDAGAIVVHGYNGAGKTSLLSALELACTGSIAHLDEAGDGAYKGHLHHRGLHRGGVSLAVELPGGDTQRTRLLVDDGGVHGEPLLEGSASEFFTERCFLPQATLARLLDIYVPREARPADTGLVRFVKELLGLDALDSLIEGLDSTGHIARAERVSAEWQVAKALLDERVAVRDSARSTLESVRITREAHRATLAAYLTPGRDDAEVHELTALASESLQVESEQSDRSAAAREATLRLSSAESLIAELGDEEIDLLPTSETSDFVRAQYTEWQDGRGRELIDWASGERPELSAEASWGASVLLRIVSTAVLTAEENVRQCEAEVARQRDAVARRSTLLARKAELETEFNQVNSAIADAVSASGASELGAVLAGLVEHVNDETCPVCDQHFSAAGGLRNHLRTKISDLNAAAELMVRLDAQRSGLLREQSRLAQDLVSVDGEISRLGSVEALGERMTSATTTQTRLQVLLPIAETGEALWRRLNQAEEREAGLASSRAMYQQASSEIAIAATMSRRNVPPGTLRQQIAALRASLRREIDEEDRRREAADATTNSLAALQNSSTDLARAEAALAAAEKAVSFLSEQLNEARRRKEAASTLRKHAEEIRAKISTRVFDDRLNGAWAKLFRTLVPSEPFTPQFVQRSHKPRTFDVGLETVHRDGTRAASPGAMLSQGNANTAALSLFLALHFAVAPRLPWLILDDPVQSMDDLHVSNFAALVKQLIRNNGRQVIIAVHQKELYDYLMLELSPGSPSEKVIGVKLDRSYGKTSIRHTVREFDPNDSVRPSSAA